MSWMTFLAGGSRRHRAWGAALVVGFALIVRLLAAREAYPVPGDAAHFVQHGRELAHGNRDGLSTYWSQGMILIAAAAESRGCESPRVLQGTSLVAGIVAIPALMLLAYSLAGSWPVALLAGLWMACSPTAVWYSVTGYSEMAYVALLLASAALIQCSFGSRRPGLLTLGAFACLGVGVYFKGLDACVAAAVLALYGFLASLRLGQEKTRRIAVVCVGFVLLLAMAAPLCLYTYRVNGVFAPGSKSFNLALGDDWKDSKAVYGIEKPYAERERYLRQHGTGAFMWHYRGELARRWIRNGIESFRIVVDDLFPGPLRLGPAWVALLAWILLYTTWRAGRLQSWALPVMLGAGPPVMIWLCLTHERVMFPSLPFVILLLSDGLVTLARERGVLSWRASALALAVCAVFAAKSSALAVAGANREWACRNAEAIGLRLRDLGSEDEVLMSSGPAIAIHFYRQHPLRTVELAYGEIADLERYCEEHHVTLIAYSDLTRAHWPAAAVFRGTPPPATWTLLEDVVIPGDDSTGIPAEHYKLFRRKGGVP